MSRCVAAGDACSNGDLTIGSCPLARVLPVVAADDQPVAAHSSNPISSQSHSSTVGHIPKQWLSAGSCSVVQLFACHAAILSLPHISEVSAEICPATKLFAQRRELLPAEPGERGGGEVVLDQQGGVQQASPPRQCPQRGGLTAGPMPLSAAQCVSAARSAVPPPR